VKLRSEAKVGLIVFIGIVALIFVYWFLGGLRLRAASYPIYGIFPNAQRLDPGAILRMSGVEIGIVSRASLVNNKARVEMRIDNACKVPVDSIARITTGGFIGENYIEISPGKSKESLRAGSRIRTAVVTQPEQLMEQTGELLNDLRASVKGLNKLLGDERMIASIKDTVTTINSAAHSAASLAERSKEIVDQAAPQFASTMANLDNASANAADLTAQAKQMLAGDVRPKTNRLFEQAENTIRNLDEAISQARQLVAALNRRTDNVDEVLAKVSQALDNLNRATANTAEMTAKLNDAGTGIRDLATDPQLQENLRMTIRNAAEASAEAKELLQSLNKRFGRRTSVEPEPKRKAPESGTGINSLWNTDTGNYRFDVYYTLLRGQDALYRIGGYNVGENTKGILQAGRLIGSGGVLRYGLYASRIGVGCDWPIGSNALLSVDLFRPNEPEGEVRGILGLSGPIGIYAGIADVFHKDNRNLLLGLQYRN